MDEDAEAALSFHKDPKQTQKWKQEKGKEEEEEIKDDEVYGGEAGSQGRSWTVVLAGFVINMLSSVGSNGFGMMFSSRLLELGSSPGLVAGVANASSAAANLISLPVAPLLHRCGCRRLLLLAGLVTSGAFAMAALAFSKPVPFAVAAIVIGSCKQVTFLVVQVAVCRCFQRGHPLAMGVAQAGATVSQIMAPPLIAFMQSYYSPRTTLIVTSGLTLHICIAAPLLPSHPDRSARRRTDYLAMVRRREMALLCLILAINSATLSVFWAMVPLALLDTGHTSHDLAVYLSISAMASLTARMTIGLLLCHFFQPSNVLKVASVLTAAAMPMWYWCERMVWRVVWLSAFGGCTGVVAGLAGLVVLEVAGLRWQVEMLGLINLSSAVTTLVLGQLVDLVRVVTGSYAFKLHAMSALLILSQGLWAFLPPNTSPSHCINEKKKVTDKELEGSLDAL